MCSVTGTHSALVVHHSAATLEAEERGVLAELNKWPREETAVYLAAGAAVAAGDDPMWWARLVQTTPLCAHGLVA